MAPSAMASSLTLVLGGVRSGKSALAEDIAGKFGEAVLYLATGQSTDPEMANRIRLHRERRPDRWQTVEESLQLADALGHALDEREQPDALLLDSVDVWVANLLLADEDADPSEIESIAFTQVDTVVDTCSRANLPAVFVSSEVGLSPVPPNRLGRQFQDLLGTVNQRLAAVANEVYLVVAGIPVKVKAQ